MGCTKGGGDRNKGLEVDLPSSQVGLKGCHAQVHGGAGQAGSTSAFRELNKTRQKQGAGSRASSGT